MRATGIIRYIDDLGRIVIPKEVRRALKIKDDDKLEIFTEHDGSIILKPCCKSWENCAIDFYNNHPYIFKRDDSPYVFYHSGHYTVCFINSDYNMESRYGVAKRYFKDSHDSRIGKVAAYARAIGQPIDQVIEYKGR